MITEEKYIEFINEYTSEHPDVYACVVTYGCQQNENDSEKIKQFLSEMGFKITQTPDNAGVVIFNTCAVRGGAEERVLGNVGALKHIKEKNPDMIIGILGCMTQQEQVADHIMKKFRHVDFVMGTRAISKFPEIMYKVISGKERLSVLGDFDGIYEGVSNYREDKIKASVSVMYGCDNFCSYCIVPYVRGRERSRRKENIIEEIEKLKDEGVKEITLLGQNVNSYGKGLYDGYDFADLIYDVAKTGINRVRFMTSHPKDISERLICAMAECENVCESLHLPFQSGSDRILKAMNRHYTKAEYLAKIETVKSKIPDIALTSDVIIGFPGETYEDVSETIDLIKKVGFDSLFTFIFSKREGTAAAKMPDPVSEKDKHKHFEMLIAEQNIISRKINESYLGNTYEVLVEGASKTNENMLTGRTRTNKIVNFSPVNARPGDLVNLKITSVKTWSLFGEEKER